MCGGCNTIHISDANSLRLFPFWGRTLFKSVRTAWLGVWFEMRVSIWGWWLAALAAVFTLKNFIMSFTPFEHQVDDRYQR